MGQDDRQAIATEFIALRGRFERVAAISHDGRRDLQASEAAAGKLLKRFCEAEGLDLFLPDIGPPSGPLDDDSSQWATAWRQGVIVLSVIYSELPVANPLHFQREYRGGPEQVTIGKTESNDWRIRSENYAAICAWLANKIDCPSLQDDASGGELSLDAMAAATLIDHPNWNDKRIAESIGCNAKTLYKKNMTKFKAAKAALKLGRAERRDDSLKDSRNVWGPDRRRRPSNINHYDPDDE